MRMITKNECFNYIQFVNYENKCFNLRGEICHKPSTVFSFTWENIFLCSRFIVKSLFYKLVDNGESCIEKSIKYFENVIIEFE